MEDEDILKRIGEKVRQLRKEAGYTSYETFAWDKGLDRRQYYRIESGETNPTMKTLLRILRVHGLTLKEFFQDIEDE